MASTIDPNIAQSLIKDATVSQGYYSVSRGTLLSRDAYADRETLDNQSSPPQKEGMANANSIKILRHGRHRFRRWWNRIYLREKYKENDNPGCNATPDTDEHAGTSTIATAGTTAGIDARDLDLSAKLSSRNDGYERDTVKRTKLDSLSSDTCSDTQIDEPSVSLEELGSFRYRNSKRFNTLKDWINKTLRRTRNSTFSSRYQQEMVISNFDFDSDQVINGKLPQSNGNNNTATTKYKPKSGASTAAMTSEGETEHERTSTPLTGSASEPSNDQVTCLDTAADDEFVVDAEQETKEKRLRMLMLESLRLAGKHRTNVASFNSIGHIGDVAIKDDDRDDNDMYIKLKDIGLSPTNEFYRELYAICNI